MKIKIESPLPGYGLNLTITGSFYEFRAKCRKLYNDRESKRTNFSLKKITVEETSNYIN